jgi:PAS domain S-box-containing protein
VQADDRIDGPGIKHARGLRGALLLIIVIFVFVGSAVAVRADNSPRRVLILHPFNYTFPATSAVSDAIRKRLLERLPQGLEIEADFLDLARNPDPAHALRMANFLREKYAGMNFDAVVALGPPAMRFMLDHRDVLGPDVPIVFSDVTRATFEAMNLPPGVIGVISEYSPERTLELAQRLQPRAGRLVVIGGTDSLDRRWLATARKVIEARNPKLETVYWSDLSYDALLTDVARLPDDTIVLLLTFFADSQGQRLIPRNVASAVATASAAPVYGFFETYLGTGIVGGYIDTNHSIGTAAADVVLQILSGTQEGRLPPRVDVKPAFRVDARAMERWGLRQDSLPPDSIVMFHEPGIWERHRLLVSAIALVLGLQSLILTALLFQRRRRRQAEDSFKESEERMTFTAASANVGLWQFNRATDELWATEHCRALFGLPNDVPLTRETILAVVHPEDRSMAVRALRGALEGEGYAMADVRIAHAEGHERWIRVRARSYPDSRGAKGQLNGIFVDITDQKVAESEAELRRQEVTHLMRVSVLGELSGAIAHEVNQPLTAILSNAQAALYLLGQDSPNLAEVRDALRDIVQEDNRAGEVVRRLRGLLKKGESRSEPVDVNELINLTIALLNSELIRRRVTVQTDLADQLPALFGDPIQLQQVLLNLVMNAMDAMESTPVAARRVTISTHVSKTRRIEVRVRDRGPGLMPAKGNKLFEAFYTTKDHGLGLGLTICSTIVQAHGGEISLVNDEAGGAVAGFSVPAHETLMAAQ